MTTEPVKCPSCGSEHIRPFFYGLPSRAFLESEDSGRYALGGCGVFPDAPAWQCDACLHEIGTMAAMHPELFDEN